MRARRSSPATTRATFDRMYEDYDRDLEQQRAHYLALWDSPDLDPISRASLHAHCAAMDNSVTPRAYNARYNRNR